MVKVHNEQREETLTHAETHSLSRDDSNKESSLFVPHVLSKEEEGQLI